MNIEMRSAMDRFGISELQAYRLVKTRAMLDRRYRGAGDHRIASAKPDRE